MAHAEFRGTQIDAAVLDLIQREHSRALSAREFRFRLAGYGYGIEDVGDHQVVTRLPKGTELGVLPADLSV